MHSKKMVSPTPRDMTNRAYTTWAIMTIGRNSNTTLT